MFSNDILISFSLMTLLFLRQIYILKQPNKINYGPLMLGIGAISSLVHFISKPESTDIIMLLRESFFPILFALLLYIVVNVIHQTQKTEHAKTHEEFTRVMAEQITKLKEFMSGLEERMNACQQEDRQAQEDVMLKFKEDIHALNVILANQEKFIERFEQMDNWHNDVTKTFEDFTKNQLPSLDSVIHKHIEVFRVAEQDHFNKINHTLEKSISNKDELSKNMDELKENMQELKNVSTEIANTIVKQTLQQLLTIIKPFQDEMHSLRSHTEGIQTALYENDSTLTTIKEKSEMVMKQMLLSSKRMDELQDKNTGLHDVYTTIKELMIDMEVIKADYVKSQAQLSTIANELKESDKEQINNVHETIKSLSEEFTNIIEESMDKLHQHYNMADEGIKQSVQIRAKQAQMQKGYMQLDN